MSKKDFVKGSAFDEVQPIRCPICGEKANTVFKEQKGLNLVFWVECPEDHYFSKFRVETRRRIKRGDD